MHLRLPELNIPTLAGSLMEVAVPASIVSLQVHLADCTLAGVGQESPLDQHLNSHVVGLSSQHRGQDSLPLSQHRGPAGLGSQCVLEVLKYEQVKL